MTKVRFKGEQPYLPFPHIHHAAKTLRKLAGTTEMGRYHLESAALVMTAFAIEAFCQTLGPEVFGEKWTNPPDGGRAMERCSVKAKLKAIGETVNVPVSFGLRPWSLIAELMQARDDLAHGKPLPPELTKIDVTLDVPDGIDPYDLVRAHMRNLMFPMHRIDRLETAADEIDTGLRRLWVAAGNPDYTFAQGSMSSWSATAT
ncbi:hypothetical protein ABQJ54_06165 [Rhodanobacter sp. Si-c]|uniref:RiboL-PSP-HEPN domain-containing protein n=1 Tax=Rhodanobacter lycopersici TaxID=3162487 RepID=A0ABV3QCA0_9GAMM